MADDGRPICRRCGEYEAQQLDGEAVPHPECVDADDDEDTSGD